MSLCDSERVKILYGCLQPVSATDTLTSLEHLYRWLQHGQQQEYHHSSCNRSLRGSVVAVGGVLVVDNTATLHPYFVECLMRVRQRLNVFVFVSHRRRLVVCRNLSTRSDTTCIPNRINKLQSKIPTVTFDCYFV